MDQGKVAVDLFFDTDNPRFSLIELVDVQEQLTAILGVETDVMSRASLHPRLRQQIEADAQRVFWRAKKHATNHAHTGVMARRSQQSPARPTIPPPQSQNYAHNG